MNLTRRLASAAMALCLSTALTGAVTTASAEEYRIGTASVGGAFFPIGQSISNLVNAYGGDDMTMVPIVTQGSVQNPRLVEMGDVEVAITNANLAAAAVEGIGPYKGMKMDLKALGALHPSVLHMVVAEDSDIQTFADLKGKRVAVGPAGGGTMGFLNNILPAHDLSLDDITPSFLSYSDGFSQLSDGNVDAALALSGYPAAAVMQAAASGQLRMVAFDPDKLAEVLEANPSYSTFDIAPEVYGMEDASTVVGVTNMLIVHADMDADTVKRITAAIYDHMDEFRAENANARQIEPERSLSLTIPLHPGAEAYFAK